MLMWIGLFVVITAIAVYFRISLLLWSVMVALGLVAMHFVPGVGTATLSLLWLSHQ